MIISSRENRYSQEGIRMADEGDFEMEKVGNQGSGIWPYLDETPELRNVTDMAD